MDFTFGDLFEKKIFEALDTCVFVVISTAIRQLPINIFISGTVDHSVFTVYIPKLEHTSTLGSWVIVSDIRLWVTGYWISFLVFLFWFPWILRLWISASVAALWSGYTYHLIGCNSMPACFHFLFEGSTENYS
ncbi:hypothetical protein I308_106065 [Cryptococcus tetragattii IND107]|uniref:Uncharacterized protein n=1 Tax=Cryptococcus tetragattii IND107 TaxID=1296105 RepID=A0ABR3BJB7_9TREE